MDNVRITLKVDGVLVSTHPVFGDDVKLKITKEDNQMFYRTKVDGKIKFSGDDFDIISQSSHNVTFTMSVYRGTSLIGEGNFLKSDCDLNYDDKVATVKLTTTDRYEKFLANYDNKYNLVKLAPKCVPLTMNKRPVLQFYFFGDTKITNSLGNMAFEVDAASGAESKTLTQLQNTYKFTRVFSYGQVHIDVSASSQNYDNASLANDATGDYKAVFSDGSLSRLEKVGGGYAIYKQNDYSGWRLYHNGSMVTLYQEDSEGYHNNYDVRVSISETGTAISVSISTWYDTGEGERMFETIGSGSGEERTILCRMLSDYSGTHTGESKVDLRNVSDDVAEENYNYRYAWTVSWLNIGANMIVSAEVQDEPTEWGIDSNGKYFVQPSPSIPNNPVYPIGWNMWIPLSFWFEDTLSIYGSIDVSVFNTTYTLPDAYPLSSAISVLLGKIDSDVTFTPNDDSLFLAENGNAGLAGFIPCPSSRGGILYITPITNVKKTRYEQAAQRGDITLKQILDMLRVVYNCYWYLDDNNHLKIEHVSFFKGGNSYAQGEPVPMVDVTAMKDMPNGLSWGFGQNLATFDRTKCPSRYEFQWADACTEQFNGYAVDIQDKLASPDKKEKSQVNNFMADVDYCIIFPNAVSDDLYVLIEANRNTKKVGLVSVSNGDNAPTYSLQNGYCSFLFAERNYLNYDYGGWDAVADGQSIEVMGARRFAKQSVNFPMPLGNVGEIGLIKTGLGNGGIEEVEVNVDTLFAKAKILLNNEWEYSRDVGISVIESELVRLYKVTNNSDTYLKVKYTIIRKSDGEIMTTPEVTLAPDGYVDSFPYTVSNYNIRVLSATPDMGKFVFGKFTKDANSQMTRVLTKISDTSCSLELKGNEYENNSAQWSYIYLVCEKPMTINLYAHSEPTYDVGYVSYTPCTKRSEVNANAIKKVSGVETDSAYIPANTPVYIGYVKDNPDYGNGDYISFGVYETN